MRTLITNCPNCAAPLKDGKCPYCGTHVRLANELDIDSNTLTEVMVNIKRGDEVILLPLVGRIESIEMSHDHMGYMLGDREFIQRLSTDVTLTFRGVVKETVLKGGL